MTEYAWTPGTATGIGSLPGTDIAEAIRLVFGELPDLPYLPELPDRGPGADMIGRTAGLLVDIPVELYAGQWRVAARPGMDARRTRDIWERDLDALTDFAADFDGLVKVQVAGPWTLAAALELAIGGRMLRDPGAVRDLVASLVEGVRLHVADVSRRLPHARLMLQIDEPSLPAVLAGHVPTESGFSVLAAVERGVATTAIADVVAAAGVPVVVHCCAPDVPIELIRDAGAVAVALDLDLVEDLDPLGEALDAGTGLFAGAVPTGASASTPSTSAPTGADVAARIRDLWKTIGFSINQLPAQVVVSPACGLAGLSEGRARAAMVTCREAAARLADD